MIKVEISKRISRYVFIVTSLLFSLMSYAQDDEPSDPPGGTDPPVSIDNYLYILILIGIILAFYKFRSKLKESN